MEVHCSVCLGPIHLRGDGDPSNDPEPVQVATHPCGHLFHGYCLQAAREKSPRCPNCNEEPITVTRIYPVYEELSQARLLRRENDRLRGQNMRQLEQNISLRCRNTELQVLADQRKTKVENLEDKIKRLKSELGNLHTCLRVEKRRRFFLTLLILGLFLIWLFLYQSPSFVSSVSIL